MGSYLRCSWCGRTYKHKGGSVARFLGGDLLGDAVTGIAGFAGDNYCSEACRQAAQGSGGSDGSSAKADAEAKLLEAQAKALEKEKQEAEKEKMRNDKLKEKQIVVYLKSYEFPKDDDQQYTGEMFRLLEDYKAIKTEYESGVKNIKKTYEEMFEREFGMLQTSNPEKYNRFYPEYEKAKKSLKLLPFLPF